MGGPFIFDDLFLPFTKPHADLAPLSNWIIGVRPTLMFSYWLSYHSAGTGTSSYHLFNILIHCINTLLVWLAVFGVLARAAVERNRRFVLASLCSLVFLLHPLQAESVAYIAGRSESLAACFFLIAYAIFVCRRSDAISWPTAMIVLFFFLLAAMTKENMLALAPVLILTDYFWNKNGPWRAIRANWRLYAPMIGVCLFGLWFVARVLSNAQTAGFKTPGIAWYQYLFTETRAIFSYLLLFLFPAGQSADHDFPISHTVFEHGALFSIITLTALIAAAVIYRKRFPLASFGFLFFLVLLAPTSSIIPINDALVERRMYLPVMALCFVVAEWLSRKNLRSAAVLGTVALVLCALGAASYERAKVWSSVEAFWSDTVASSPAKGRAYWNLAQASVAQNQCDMPVPYLQKADTIIPNDPYVLASWAKVLGCSGKLPEALDKLKTAEKLAPDSAIVFDLEGLIYGQMQKFGESKAALDKAIAVDPGYLDAYGDRALWYEYQKQYPQAIADYRAALQIDPRNFDMRVRLARAEQLARN